MKVLMINTFDEVGGAARAAVRLLEGVRAAGVDVSMLVQFKSGKGEGVLCRDTPLTTFSRRLKVALGTLPVRFYPNRPENNFSPAVLSDSILSEIDAIDPDLIHLHWTCAGFVRPETLARIRKPIVWTLHDSWAFTGGCHVPSGCEKYGQSCGACPVLGSSRENDLSRRIWQRKKRAWRELDLTVVAPSRWLAGCARSSSLFRKTRVEVIPNGLDTDLFRPREKEQARRMLGLPVDKKIILFGSVRAISDPNKGLDLLLPALQALGKSSSDTVAVLFNAFDRSEMPDLGMPSIAFGPIHDDDKLASIYSAADVFVVPSRQETFCQTAAEAMACGTPVVAFGATGLLDVVDHLKTGYLAQPFQSDDLKRGISWVLEDEERLEELSSQARKKVIAEFGIQKTAGQNISLYQNAISPL